MRVRAHSGEVNSKIVDSRWDTGIMNHFESHFVVEEITVKLNKLKLLLIYFPLCVRPLFDQVGVIREAE